MIKDVYSNINDCNNLSLDFGEISNLTHEYYEYEQGQADIIVKSRLKKHYNFWKNIDCYDYILDTIYNGYRIPFFSTPPSICLSNNRSAVNHSEFVVEAIHDLLIKGLIEECESKPIVVNPLIVSVSSRKIQQSICEISSFFSWSDLSMSCVIGNVTNIMTKYLSIDILDKQSRNSAICLSKESLDQIAFWNRNLRTANLKEFTSDLSCHTIVYSDASNTGYDCYMVENPSDIAHGMWSNNESMKSSTWKELTAVKSILFSMNKFLHNKRIKWFTDNQNVVSIINKGSIKGKLQDIAISMLCNCLNNNISIDVEWIPRCKNDQADFISRIVDYAFTVKWNGVNGWFVPPVCIVSRVLRYMKQCLAFGTIIVPLWRSTSLWPILFPSGDGFIKEVNGCINSPTNKIFLNPGKGTKGVLGNIDLPFRMPALKIDYR